MKKIKLPSTTVILLASLTAFWLADIINPSFNYIGIGVLLLIPVFVIEFLYPKSGMADLFEQPEPVLDGEEAADLSGIKE